MESDRDRRFALEGFVRYHDDRIWKQTQKLVREIRNFWIIGNQQWSM